MLIYPLFFAECSLLLAMQLLPSLFREDEELMVVESVEVILTGILNSFIFNAAVVSDCQDLIMFHICVRYAFLLLS